MASERCDLNQVPLAEGSWTLRNDRSFYVNQENVETLSNEIELGEGDTIGIAYDHVTLQFYLNGITIGNGKVKNL